MEIKLIKLNCKICKCNNFITHKIYDRDEFLLNASLTITFMSCNNNSKELMSICHIKQKCLYISIYSDFMSAGLTI